MSKVTVNLTPPRGTVEVLPSWTMSLMERAKGFPGRTRMVGRVLHFELSRENVSYATMAFPHATVIGGAQPDQADEMLVAGRPPFATAFPMDPLQLEAFEAAKGKKVFGFFEKPGAGKTKMILDHAVRAWCAGEIDALLVVSYNGVHEQWILDEAPKHISKTIPWRGVARIPGKKFDKTIFDQDPGVLRIFAINYESYAVSEAARGDIQKFYRSGRVMIAADESQRIMNPEARVTEEMTADQAYYSHRLIASGEPTPRGLENYYSQINFLDPAILNVWSYAGYKARYCRMNQHREIIGYHNMEELHRLMAPYVHVGAPKIDAEQIFIDSKFDLGPEARLAYNTMRDEMLIMLEDGSTASVRNVLARMVRLQQIACGYLVLDDGSKVRLPSERNDLVATLLDMHGGQKAIVWALFKDDHVALAEKLGGCAAVYNGDTSKADRRDIVAGFLDPKSSLKYMVASTAAAGTGLNLQGSSWLNIYHSNSGNAGTRWQSERRTYRRGVTRDVLYYDVMARNTVDIGVRRRHMMRRDISDMSIAELRSLLLGDEL